MKILKNDFTFILIILLFKLLINFILPSNVYALEPELIDTDYVHSPTHTYWLFYQGPMDVYAANQSSIHLQGHSIAVESINYPVVVDHSSSETAVETSNSISKMAHFKSKIAWFTWKKYSNEFESFKQFESSINGSFSLRSQLREDLIQIFRK